MHEWYERTALTPMRVARSTGYIDWSMQPSLFKTYPEGLFSYGYTDHEALKLVALARSVTDEQSVGGKPYLRLNTPSAGNLHPLELYVQIRGIKGIVSGIYHVDARRERVVLLREVESDGLEAALGLCGRFRGMLFVLSRVPFRSEWKYGERSWRYTHLDAGHQVGALQAAAAACGQEVTLLSEFDGECLDAAMGFDLQEESVAVLLAGECGERECSALKQPLMRVQPTDYFEPGSREPRRFDRTHLRAPELVPGFYEQMEHLESVIAARRSSRGFDATPLGAEEVERLMQILSKPPQPLVCHTLLLRGEAPEPGVYEGNRLVRGGSFVADITALLVDQPFVSTSSLVLIVSAPAFGADALMTAGAFAHALHLYSRARGLGFSGVGAFYDRKLQQFLKTDNYILYTCVIGSDPQLKRDAL